MTSSDQDKASMLRDLSTAMYEQFLNDNPKSNRKAFYRHGWAAGFEFGVELTHGQSTITPSVAADDAKAAWTACADNATGMSLMMDGLTGLCPPEHVQDFRGLASKWSHLAREYQARANAYVDLTPEPGV